MPPCPISRMMRYAPILLPVIARDCADTRSATGPSSRKVSAPSKLDSSDSTSLRRPSSPAQAWRRKLLLFPGSCSRANANSSFTWSHFSGIVLVASAQFPRQPGLGQVPIALHRRTRNSQNCSGLVKIQAAEETQLHKLGLLWIEFGQPGESFIHGNDIRGLPLGNDFRFLQENLLEFVTAFLGVMAAAVVNQDAAHQLRRDAHELLLIFPVRLSLIGQAQIRFMHEGGGLQGVIAALPPQITGRQTSQF